MLTLEKIISYYKDSREVRRALAVKMLNNGLKVLEIEGILQVSDFFLKAKWKLIYQTEGGQGLLLRYPTLCTEPFKYLIFNDFKIGR